MTAVIAKSNMTVIVGLGLTGLSVARYLAAQGRQFMVVDTRAEPPNLQRFRTEFPGVACELGGLNRETLCAAAEIILSPGMALTEVEIAAACAAKVPVIGDIELFSRTVQAPVIAITGSNAKSTVTTLVGEMARLAGKKVAVGGNLGTPALDLLSDDIDLYVVELSSFQLETTHRLNARVATILNVTEDHLDRYDSMTRYHAAKQRIYFGAQQVVVNRDDILTHPPLAKGTEVFSFGCGEPDKNGFGLRLENRGQGEQEFIAFEFEPLMPVQEVAMRGRHNLINALSALALGHAAGLPMDAMLEALRKFQGLPHRCQWVAEKGGVEFFNDSKATNVGATLAAIRGLARSPAKLVLIAGGESKGADFNSLSGDLRKNVRTVVVIGSDWGKIAAVADKVTQVVHATDMKEAVASAFAAAKPGDAVLLSPACASFDMFKNYEDRGQNFIETVEGLRK